MDLTDNITSTVYWKTKLVLLLNEKRVSTHTSYLRQIYDNVIN
uniref:Uncharacterized protein n=1 Tax=Anguilla anguilla TaxID=7936 RepID=A0A0E9TT04_ANGAN